jgi:hypothetical protein
MQSAARESVQEAVDDRDDPSSETRATDESIATNLNRLALTPKRSGEYDGRLVLTRKESELQVGRRNLDLLPQIMAYRFAEMVLESVDADADEEEENVDVNKQDAEGADGGRDLDDDVAAPSGLGAAVDAFNDPLPSKSRGQARSDGSWSDNEDYFPEAKHGHWSDDEIDDEDDFHEHTYGTATANLDKEQDETGNFSRAPPTASQFTPNTKFPATSKEKERARYIPRTYISGREQRKPDIRSYMDTSPPLYPQRSNTTQTEVDSKGRKTAKGPVPIISASLPPWGLRRQEEPKQKAGDRFPGREAKKKRQEKGADVREYNERKGQIQDEFGQREYDDLQATDSRRQVQYAARYHPEGVIYKKMAGRRSEEDSRPSIPRSATYAY